ncbi:TIGR03943 family protein [Paenibacillus abyssi]|uniref:TIGR03943 family protein n=2 Tax=Paenibacillus abyssi TaxID=1340531 RepID=A0A917CSQ0_9BACL|nr:TIGR03943 family protein [Paenibacillus abyssi]
MIHHLIRGIILTGFAFLIVYLVRSDNLTLYIAPRMAGYVKVSALVLYAAAIYQFYAAFQTWMGRTAAVDCGCDHTPSHSLLKNTLIYGLFVFPLALGFLLPDTMMGSSLAAKKGISLSGSQSINRPDETASASSQEGPIDELDRLFPSDIYTESYAKNGKKLYLQDVIKVEEKQFIETLTTIDLYREQYIGKTIELSGFVYREEKMSEQQFVVSRFAMNCCSADSLPYGLMISSPEAIHFDNDTWLQVRGTIMIGTYNGNEIIIVKAQKLEQIAAPDSPYVYPDYDFGL